MAPRCRAIPAEEWERHKATIRSLFAQKNLTEVIDEMKLKHNFAATKSQYEAKLREWNIRKYLSQKQWKEYKDKSGNTPAAGLMTSSGYVRSQPSIQRALRRLNPTAEASPAQESAVPMPLNSLSQLISSLTTPPVEQFVQTTPFTPLPEQQILDMNIERERSSDVIVSSPGLALMGLGEATANFNSVEPTWSIPSESDNPISSPLVFASYSAMEYLFQDGDISGMELDSSLEWMCQTPVAATPSSTRDVVSMRRTIPGSPPQVFFNHDSFFSLISEPIDGEIFSIPSATTIQSPRTLAGQSTNVQVLAQDGGFNRGNSELSLSRATIKRADNDIPAFGFSDRWLQELPFAKFEVYMYSDRSPFSRSGSSNPQNLGASLFENFALRSLVNSFYSGSEELSQYRPADQSTLHNLGQLLPGASTAIMSPQQTSASRLVRILLFSIINGFVGLSNIPMEDILKSMGHIVTSKILLQILEEGPRFTSRTLADNMFRAAIEAKDQHIVQSLLERKLVHVNDTVCYFQNKRYTPVERAALLQALALIRTLTGAGADVNRTYEPEEIGGPLRILLQTLINKSYRAGEVTVSPELANVIDLLIAKGSKIDLDFLRSQLQKMGNNNKIAGVICSNIPWEEHHRFFNDEDPSLVTLTADNPDEDTSISIIQNMIQNCERAGCFKCLEMWPNQLENAAVEGAVRGHSNLVQLLLSHLKSTTRVLCGAISSGNKALIGLILNSNTKPELNPPAFHLTSHYQYSRRKYELVLNTTPLAEALRAANVDLFRLLEESGALENIATGGRLEALLFAAAEVGNVSYLDYLLQIGSSSLVKHRPHDSALIVACKNGHVQAAKLLLSAGAEVADTSFYGHSKCTALRLALSQNLDHTLVTAILNADVGPLTSNFMQDVESWFDISVLSDLAFVFPDALHNRNTRIDLLCKRCMETDNVEFFRLFLESTFFEAYDLDACLAVSTGAGHADMVELLLQMGADPFDRKVVAAAIPKQTQMLQLLFGEDRKLRTSRRCIGASTLKFILAELPGNAAVLNGLLDANLVNLKVPEDTNVETYNGEMLTPLGLAIIGISGFCTTNIVAIDRLLRAGSDPNRIARLHPSEIRIGETALMLAIETGQDEVVRLLLNNGADLNKKPFLIIKQTPLQFAAKLGNLDMVRLLLSNGAEINDEPAIRSGGTALQFAAISGNCNVAAELLKRGARLHALPSKVNGRWPLEAASENGRLDMIDYLWKAKGMSVGNAGFERRHCIRAMNFAGENGHLGCRDLISELSGISIDAFKTEEHGVPWLAY